MDQERQRSHGNMTGVISSLYVTLHLCHRIWLHLQVVLADEVSVTAGDAMLLRKVPEAQKALHLPHQHTRVDITPRRQSLLPSGWLCQRARQCQAVKVEGWLLTLSGLSIRALRMALSCARDAPPSHRHTTTVPRRQRQAACCIVIGPGLLTRVSTACMVAGRWVGLCLRQELMRASSGSFTLAGHSPADGSSHAAAPHPGTR